MNTPQIDIIVTRHAPLVTYLVEVGLATNETPVMPHVTADDVRNKHVLGVLPHHLSCVAATITEIPMRWTIEDREAMTTGDVELDAVRKAAGRPVTYVVNSGYDGPSSAFAAAMRHATGPNGHRVDFLINDKETILEVSDHDGYASSQVDLYRGAVRHHQGTLTDSGWGPWIDPLTGERWHAWVKSADGSLRPISNYPTDRVNDLLAHAS